MQLEKDVEMGILQKAPVGERALNSACEWLWFPKRTKTMT